MFHIRRTNLLRTYQSEENEIVGRIEFDAGHLPCSYTKKDHDQCESGKYSANADQGDGLRRQHFQISEEHNLKKACKLG